MINEIREKMWMTGLGDLGTCAKMSSLYQNGLGVSKTSLKQVSFPRASRQL